MALGARHASTDPRRAVRPSLRAGAPLGLLKHACPTPDVRDGGGRGFQVLRLTTGVGLARCDASPPGIRPRQRRFAPFHRVCGRERTLVVARSMRRIGTLLAIGTDG